MKTIEGLKEFLDEKLAHFENKGETSESDYSGGYCAGSYDSYLLARQYIEDIPKGELKIRDIITQEIKRLKGLYDSGTNSEIDVNQLIILQNTQLELMLINNF